MKKHISKSLCWVLVCAMLLAQLLIPGYADTATRTVYVDINGSGWSTVNIYAWNDYGDCTGQWPGSSMLKKSGNVYSFEVPAVAQYVIFNNGTDQTGDLLLPADGKDLFNWSSGTWGYYTQPTGNTRPIYVDITGFDWDRVNVYTWNDSGACTGQWPGTPMTKLRDNVYYYEIPTEALNVIFNDGTDQTNDLTVPNDGTDFYNYMQNSWSSYDAQCIHSYTEQITLAASCTQNGLKTYTCSLCGLHYTESIPATGHMYSWRPTADPTCDTEGIKTYTCNFCGDSYTETFPATGHSWAYGRCTVCGTVCDHNWIDGICRNCSSACGHRWSNGTCQVCKLVCNHSNWMDGACVHCSMTCSHSFSNGFCTICGMTDANQDKTYCLVGYINGKNHGFEEDYGNIGDYILVNGKLTTSFTSDSYVFIKTTDNANWYMTHGYSNVKAAIFYDTDTGVAEKMFVPGNVEVTFTLTENQDGSLTLSYLADAPECEHVYSAQLLSAATCTNSAVYGLTCATCGDYFAAATYELAEQWLPTVPSGMSSRDFEGQVMYRYRELEDGTWRRYSTKQVVYVDAWPSGFDTNNDLYSLYNNASKKAAPFENSAARQVIDSDEIGGYLYYHWCCQGDPYSVANKSGSHDRFHAYFSNATPADADQVDPGDNSYCFNNATACADCKWFFAVPVYSQVYSTYTANAGWGAWSDWSVTPMAASASRQVQSDTVYRYTGQLLEDHSYQNGSCTVCGQSEAEVQQPETYYLVGFINGANYGCEEDHENMGQYKFVDGKLTAKFDTDSYVFLKTEGNGKWLLSNTYCTETQCTFSEGKSEKMFVPGGVELSFTLVERGDGSVTLSYTEKSADCSHSYTSELTRPASCQQGSITTYTCSLCGHSYTEEGNPWSHNFVNGSCTMCSAPDPNYVVPKENIYLVGFINGANHGCEEDSGNMGDYLFVDGKLVVTFTQDSYVFLKKQDNAAWYMSYTYGNGPRCNFYNTATNTVREKMLIPGGVEVTIYLSSKPGDSYELSYTTPQMVCPHTNHDLDGICTACGHQLTHLYVDGFCQCGKAEVVEPPLEYFLFGYINGANYGCEEDYENMGIYKFVDGKLVATFTENSYVGVKTTGNADWFMTNGYNGEYPVARLYNTKTLGQADKLFVPGGLEITFKLEVNWDKTLSLSYTTAQLQTSTVPTLTLKAPTLEFKDMITVNAFYTAENTEDVTQMGMITYSSKVDAWSVETAEHVIPGYSYDETTGRYLCASQGIHAKYLGDTVYLAVYAKLKDGSYAYSKLASYSPVQYAASQLKNSADPKLKQLVAAMLNYGAEAQLFFGYNTGALANASMTAEQKALPAAYNAGMVSSVPAASAAKQGNFANNSGFSSRYPAISFEGAFCINYFFTPKYTPNHGITLYYWNAAAYQAASVLTPANATGYVKLEGSEAGEYRGDITGIAAKNISEAVYVAAVYEYDGASWTSGVLGYSIGAYCSSQASKGSDIAALAKATAVYGYHAKAYFG